MQTDEDNVRENLGPRPQENQNSTLQCIYDLQGAGIGLAPLLYLRGANLSPAPCTG